MASALIPSNYQPHARCSDAMPMSEKINLCQVQGPCRAGTQRSRLSAARGGTGLRAGRGRFLLPGIVPLGSPGLTPATCYFCSKVLSGVNTSLPALGTFLRAGPGQGCGLAPAAGVRPWSGPAHGPGAAWPWRQGGFLRVDLGRPRCSGCTGTRYSRLPAALGVPEDSEEAQTGDILEATAPGREG